MIHHAGRFSSSPYTGDQKKITELALGVSGTSKAKKQTALRVEEKSDREMVQKGTLLDTCLAPSICSNIDSVYFLFF